MQFTMKCGCEHATRTQRLIDGKPADKKFSAYYDWRG